jgi:hypothetical protein
MEGDNMRSFRPVRILILRCEEFRGNESFKEGEDDADIMLT